MTTMPMKAIQGARLTMAALLTGTMMAPVAAWAQNQKATADEPVDSDEIVVTASKREENLQDVPMSVQALGDRKLDELQVTQLSEFTKFLPSVSIQSAGPGFSNVYFRGVASGGDGNHSSSLPSVGTYLDEQPITTIQGALDIHVYDIARVEALAGPQGTLYGASSQAGTIKMITNKPDVGSTYGRADLELNKVTKGGMGYVGEAMGNFALNDKMAVRIVGYYDHDAGYIDNIAGSLTFPTSGITMTNAPYVKKNYNKVDTYGGRVALGIDLDEDWTVTPTIMAQKQKAKGSFGVERGLGDLQTMQFNPEMSDDRWVQAALTVQGKVGNWDVTYAGALLKRRVDTDSDYVDYAYFYDTLAGYGAYFYDNAGNLVNPNQYIQGKDRFTKQSHELRFTSPQDASIRFIGGLFWQHQKHNIRQDYIIDNIADSITVPGTASDIWLTQQVRKDRDYAIFGEVSYDIMPKLTVTGGGRLYKYDNSLEGFFGYSAGYSSRTGVAACFKDSSGNLLPATIKGAPCTNVDKRTKDSGFIHKLNLTYKHTDDLMVYATWSRGFRPGGINRRGTLPPYLPDFLTNYEIGLKSNPAPGVRLNAAIYQEDWKDIQLSFLGVNGLTEIRNAGNARIRGIELDAGYRAGGFSINIGASYNDAKIVKNFCLINVADYNCALPAGENEELAPAGTRLPITAKFKGNVVARYDMPLGELDAHVQMAAAYEGKRSTDLRLAEREIQGWLPAYTSVDASAGVSSGVWDVELYVRNLFDKRGAIGNSLQCPETVCGDPDGLTAIGGKVYTYVIQPRTIGIKVGMKF